MFGRMEVSVQLLVSVDYIGDLTSDAVKLKITSLVCLNQ